MKKRSRILLKVNKAEKPHKGRKPAKGSKKKEAEKKEKQLEEDVDEESESKSRLGLSGRKDVVYKTLLRSVKRYYSSEFESRTEYNGLTKSKQEKRCMKIIERFTRDIFAEHMRSEKAEDDQQKEYVSGIDFNDICSFILALIIPSYVKRNCRFTPTYTVYDTFYECLYRYSHKRLEAALAIDSVACVFKIFLEGPVFENLLDNDGTLSKNREAFESAKQEFLEIISKRGTEEYPAVIS